MLMHYEFSQLDDTVVKSIETSDKKQLKESRDILLRIRRRDLYRVCNISHFLLNMVLRFCICTKQVLVYNNNYYSFSSQFCNEYTVPKEKIEYFKDITPQDIVCSQV